MKIALLSAFYPYRGGVAQFSAMLYRTLEEEHKVKAYTFKRQYPSFLFPGASQFVTNYDNPDVIEAERVLDTVNPFSFGSSAKKVNAFEPDLFIGQYWMTFFGPSMGGVYKRVNKQAKRISILHNVIPHEKRFFDKGANNYFLKHNDGFVVMSDTVLNDLLSLKPDAKYLRIDHPAYDQFGEKLNKETAIGKLDLPTGKAYLLFFGFIRTYKGLDILLEAMGDLTEDIHLIVAGEVYGNFDKYQSIIDSLNLKERVHLFNNYIGDDEVSSYFSAADVCILPYKGATQSGITAISHHFDLPIIATDVGGLRENTRHNETGLIVKEPDGHLIANSIKQYFNKDLKSKFSNQIAQDKTENSWENFAKKIIDFSKTL
ncbi:MAG: glycosyltransferase [Crocinitomicaceae bacterium]|nr:glycosyltransferase [Crocinitomicaceae bacterium]